MWLTKKQLKGLVGAERLKDSPPVPTRMVSNGEYLPIAQTQAQARVERLVHGHGRPSRNESRHRAAAVPALRHRPRREFLRDESRVRRFLHGGSC